MVTLLTAGDSEKIEIIKENGDTKVYPKVSKYPLKVRKAAGASLPDKTIVICGGEDNAGRSKSKCYRLANGQWKIFGQLHTARFGSGGSLLGNSIWFTGGFDSNTGYRLETTEILNSDGTVTLGPNLPNDRNMHCQVTYEDTILIIGEQPFDQWYSRYLPAAFLLQGCPLQLLGHASGCKKLYGQ